MKVAIAISAPVLPADIAPAAERLRRLVIHRHRDVAVLETRDLRRERITRQQGRHAGAVAKDDDAEIRAAQRELRQRRDDDIRPGVTAHRIDCYRQALVHPAAKAHAARVLRIPASFGA
jgi:hypothetical protein